MVNLCVCSLVTVTSPGVNVKAGTSIVASFIALSNVAGNCGSSAGTPSTILNSPSTPIYNTDFLGK